jgi:hypothetical protein
MGKVFERIENGVTTHVSVKEGLAEVNDAMMGRVSRERSVRRMSSGRTQHHIEYADGRDVRMTLVDAPEPTDTEAPREWRGTHSNFSNLHRFVLVGTDPKYGDQYRARCNKGIRPAHCMPKDKPSEYRTRGEVLASEHADLYTFCPRCEAK